MPLQEPCFIPRRPDAPEGDGWIAQAATDAATGLTLLNLFDATAIAKGPDRDDQDAGAPEAGLPRQLARGGRVKPFGGDRDDWTALDYKAYEALFNTGDDEALVDTFFADDVVFSGGDARISRRGAAARLPRLGA